MKITHLILTTFALMALGCLAIAAWIAIHDGKAEVWGWFLFGAMVAAYFLNDCNSYDDNSDDEEEDEEEDEEKKEKKP